MRKYCYPLAFSLLIVHFLVHVIKPKWHLIFLLTFFSLVFHFLGSAFKPEKVFIRGGEMILENRKIVVESFEIMKYEVSNAEYASFLNAENIGSNGLCHGILLVHVFSEDLQLEYNDDQWRPKTGKENFPMVMVSYFGAMEYSKWLGGRLPNEDEWIYAAKGGFKSKNYIYAGSNNLNEVGWYKLNSEGHAHEVGKKKPNELGIYDMSGNAWEWCRNDTLKSETGFCVHKGGSWYAVAQPGEIAAHYGNNPTHFSNSVGFRVIFKDQDNN